MRINNDEIFNLKKTEPESNNLFKKDNKLNYN